MKKFFSKGVAILIILLVATISFGYKGINEVKADSPKDIDMYLIAGQSNAAGYSPYTDLSETQLNAKYNNIMYGGQTDKLVNGTSIGQNWLNYSDYKSYVTIGYGTNGSCIGPEYGMAKVLNDVYTSTEKAFIFKTAAGGTCLKNDSRASGNGYGNWYPRSLWPDSYEPDLTSTDLQSNYTGYLYKLFVENFKTVYTNLKSNGYNPIVKGMVWMQGEEDIGLDCTGYDALLKQFISDIREDIYTITNDEKTIDMRFVIGKIATTFASPDNTGVPIMNSLQDKVAKEMDYVETIETSDLIITYYEGGNIKTKGADKYHFCGTDDITLGERFANKLLSMEESTDGKVKLRCTNGNVTCSQTGNQITITDISANLGYKLASVTVNDTKYYNKGQSGYPIVSYQNDQMVLDVTSLGNPIRYNVFVYFEADTRVLAITNDSTMGRVVTNPNGLKQQIGTTITIDVQPFSGYEVDVVKFNDEVINKNTDGKYTITYGNENKLEVTYKEIENKKQSEDNKQTKSGCGSTVNYSLIFVIIALAIITIKLTKEGAKQ